MVKRVSDLFFAFILILSLLFTVSCKSNEQKIKERIVMDIYGNGYNTNMLVGFDEQGRTVKAVSSERENKDVGIFYFLWLDGFADIYLNSEIRDKYGDNALFHEVSDISPENQFHWWAEPLFGYYNSSDEWVIRKHMEMLTNSGIDFLVFDTTNGFTYPIAYTKILKVCHEMNEEGWDAPQIAFYTHSLSIQTITKLYNDLYSKDLYPDTWYRIDGKPLIIGYTDGQRDYEVAGSLDSYRPKDLPAEIQQFFHIRTARWPGEPVEADSFPYTEWEYPQPLNKDLISVSIASHVGVPFSFSLTHENWMNWGRGYNVDTGKNVEEDVMKGTFFQSQWQTVFDVDPDMVFITGWNEWVALKSLYMGEYMFCDNVDMEYSRDAEPMRGGYEDAYYIQMMMNIRQYKYNSIDNYVAGSVKKSIDINADFAQWDEVNAIYRNLNIANVKRRYKGASSGLKYTMDANRNNIEYIKTTSDSENIYMMIKCTEDIVTADDSAWMNIFIGLGEEPSMNKGWESYEYVINRSRDAVSGSAKIERLNSDFSGHECGSAKYIVSGSVMQIEFPKSSISLETNASFYFKVADGVLQPEEIMSYYESGMSMPIGRLSYLYQTYTG